MNSSFASAPVGAVLERPTGELALLWLMYAAAQDKIEEQRKELHKLRKRKNA